MEEYLDLDDEDDEEDDDESPRRKPLGFAISASIIRARMLRCWSSLGTGAGTGSTGGLFFFKYSLDIFQTIILF